jgi:hypothetical protein
MQKIYFILGIFLLFLFQSPVVFSLDCKQISSANQDVCKEILNSDLSLEEREMIILNLDYQSSFFPDHDYIFDRNTDLEIKEAPNDVDIQEKKYIKSAWAKIFAIMPSIQYDGELYSPKESSILTGFNYEIDIPNNYYSSKYPRTSKGDCKRKYYLEEKNAINRVYVNNRYIGKGELVDILLTRNSKIKVMYDIYVKIKIKHYEWDKDCIWRSFKGRCVKYVYDCEYDYTEYRTERVSITDTLNMKLYDNNLFAEVSPVKIYDSITNYKLNYSDSINVNLKNSDYSFNKYIYNLNYSFAPYYIVNLVAKDYNQEIISNLFSGNNLLTVKNAKNCKLEAFDFFSVLEKDCETNYEDLNLSIKTDKFKYIFGDKINIKIYPNNLPVNLTYGDSSKISTGKSSFVAKQYENRIVAEYNGIIYEKIIHVVDNSKLLLLWKLLIFVLLNYFIYKLLKKYYGRIK